MFGIVCAYYKTEPTEDMKMKTKNIYSVTFNGGDGYEFKLFSNARKALHFARTETNTNGTLQGHTEELSRVRKGFQIFFYTQNHNSFIVAKEFIL